VDWWVRLRIGWREERVEKSLAAAHTMAHEEERNVTTGRERSRVGDEGGDVSEYGVRWARQAFVALVVNGAAPSTLIKGVRCD